MGRLFALLSVALLLTGFGPIQHFFTTALPGEAHAEPVAPPPPPAVPGAGEAIPPPPPTVEAPLMTQLKFEQGSGRPDGDTTLAVVVKVATAPQTRADFLCEIRTEEVMREAWIRAQIRDAKGEILHDERIDLAIQPGLNRCQFTWDTEKIPYGVYWARFSLMRGTTFESAWREVVLTKMAELPLAEQIERASAGIADLRQHLEGQPVETFPAPYARMRVAIAEDFAVRARQSFARGQWQRAGYYATYVLETVTSVRARLALAKDLPELFAPIPAVSLGRVERRGGAFHAGGRPVFLLGGRGGEDLMRDMPRLRAYGLNFAAFDITPGEALPAETPPADALASLDKALDVAETLNLSVTCLLSPFELTDWAAAKWPEARATEGPTQVNLVTPAARDYIANYVRTAVGMLQGRPTLSSVCLAQSPAFQFEGPAIREGFLGHIREAYGDVEEINRVWKARFRNMDELNLIWEPGRYDYVRRVGYQYDWQTYHQWLGTEFLLWMEGVASGAAPGIPYYVQVSNKVLEPGESRLGIDREALARAMDLNGCAVANSPEDGLYAMSYPHASFLYTLLRSFAPDKPLINSEHVLLAPNYPYGSNIGGYVHSALWEGAVSGLNASALASWKHGELGDGLDGAITDRPESLEAYATACLDLNRLAEIVVAFQQAPADVAILWSMPSKIFEEGDPYLASVKEAYEGCSFGGRKVRFISEDQILAGGLEGVSVLVIPNAPALGQELMTRDAPAEADRTFRLIDAYVDAGGVVIRTSNPIPYTARGTSRQDLLLPSAHTILIRGNDTASGYLDAMDAAYAMGALDPVPRIVNASDYPIEGVKTEYVEFGGHGYLYVLNLRKEAVACTLEGPRQAGRDLIRGQWMTFPTVVQPLAPMLIQLEEVDPATAMPVVEIGKPVEEPKPYIGLKDRPRGVLEREKAAREEVKPESKDK